MHALESGRRAMMSHRWELCAHPSPLRAWRRRWRVTYGKRQSIPDFLQIAALTENKSERNHHSAHLRIPDPLKVQGASKTPT